jgi:two-component system, chemotaxis family, CheB/CheR fusion protein
MSSDQGLDGIGPERKSPAPFWVAGIGASAGGLEALTALLQSLPADPGLSLVLVLHLSRDRESEIAALLSRATSLPVQEATDGVIVERNHVYVIPPNTEMRLQRRTLRLRPRPPRPRAHMPVDVFLFSLAEEQSSRAMGVVLSGADSDGTRGLQAIQQAGGRTFAQDRTAKVSAMPENSIASGAVDFIGSPEEIAHELVRLAQEPRPDLHLEEIAGEQFAEILALLHDATRVDFTSYKPKTLRRRILRRMALNHFPRISEYLQVLRTSRSEIQALYKDILINVTHFFRYPEAFDALENHVIPTWIDRLARPARDPIRIWVPGCSTGEEVYSIAMCVLEALGDAASRTPLQVFGTDLSETAINKARAGLYAADTEGHLTPERLQRFFVQTPSGIQVKKHLRDACVFATHDIARDPPFPRLDLISCRNVLIYMSAPLQQRVIQLLHYGLNPQGYLLLGPAESTGKMTDLFTVVEQRWSLYQKVEGPARARVPQSPVAPAGLPRVFTSAKMMAPHERDVSREAESVLNQVYAPPAVVINEQMEVLHFHGRTAPYLEPPSGKANHHLLAMAAEGLRTGIVHAVREALESNAPAIAQAQMESLGHEIQIRASLLGSASDSAERFLLVVFEDQTGAQATARSSRSLPEPDRTPNEAAIALARSREELAATRQQLQSMIEFHGAAQEELQSANEEILSSNEELQSTNEELQTSKEEVESTNEELSTVNEELHARVGELSRLNDDWANVLASVQIPIVILGPALQIRSFTPAAASLFRLIAADIGRPLADINIGILVPDFEALLKDVLDTLHMKVTEVQDRSGNWHQLRARPYRTREDRIDGLILALVDIDEIKRAADAIAAARDYAEAIVATVQRPLLILDADLSVHTANPAFYRAFSVSREESEGKKLYELGNRQWDIPELRTLLEEIIPQNQCFDDFAVEHVFPKIGRRIMRINARRIESKAGVQDQLLIALDDVTARLDQERALQERDQQLVAADVRKNEFLAMLAHELRTPMAPIVYAASLLRKQQGELRDEGVTERAAEIIMRQSKHMARLIEDLVDVARITRGKVELRKERVALQGILAAAIEASRPAIEAREHTFQLSVPMEPLEVDVDPTRLEQVISNLLHNAAKYTPPGGRVELSAEQDSAGAVVIRVRDTGVGILPEARASIFELFAQENNTLDHGSGGLGIGLTVARNLVEMHGGTLEVESSGLGEGSEFIVRLAAAGEAAEAARGSLQAAASQPEATPKRVLLVEDNEDAVNALVMLLRSWGHDVRTFATGFDALEAAEAFRPDIALVDIALPVMNGYKVARELQRIPSLKDTRLIAMTGYGQGKDRARSLEAGFEEHLVKPVSLEVLEALVGNARKEPGAPNPASQGGS